MPLATAAKFKYLLLVMINNVDAYVQSLRKCGIFDSFSTFFIPCLFRIIHPHEATGKFIEVKVARAIPIIASH